MSERLSDEQADAVRDAVAVVRIVKQHGISPVDIEKATSDLEPVLEGRSYDELAMIVGVLAAMAAGHVEDEVLDAAALGAIGLR